ncbi:MAG: hypothetical protein PHH77_13205 [Victivallaceae bacterium]|nr:hypothetical protein [Victivallaceae bacterium]
MFDHLGKMTSGIGQIYEYSGRKCSDFLRKTDWRCWLAFFFFSILLTGIFTVPRFNDGIFHLAVAREWFNTGSRPLTVWELPVAEEPLWYFLVKMLCSATGSFSYRHAQVLQSLLYAGILIFTYKTSRFQTQSDFAAKCALIFAGSIPMLSVTSVLCFIDVLCAFFVILAIWFLINRKFFWAVLAGAGVWYAKRTGLPETLVFFLIFSIYLFQTGNKERWKTFSALAGYGLLFLALIVPDLIFRISEFSLESSYAITFSTKKVLFPAIAIIHSASAARGICLNDSLLWLGGAVPVLILLLPVGIRLFCRRHRFSVWFLKNYVPISVFILTVALFMPFSLGRVTIRYWAIVISPAIIGITAILCRTGLRPLVAILAVGALAQHCCVIAYLYDKRQTGISERQVLGQLREVAADKKIIWYETHFARYHLGRKIYWRECLRELLRSGFSPETDNGDIGAIVVAKRYLYPFRGVYYDRGFPCALLERLKKNNKFKLVLENSEYYVFTAVDGKQSGAGK